jgi:clan AA aspartic protease (TIGR02281 family)
MLFIAQSDEIKLKSGGSITGIITEAKPGTITINVGFGNTVIDSTDIASITRSDTADHNRLRAQWHDRFADGEMNLSPALKPFMEKLRRLRALRIRAINRQRELEKLDVSIDSLEHALSDNAEAYQALNSELSDLSQKDLEEQYKLVGKAHQHNALIISLQNDIANKTRDQKNGNPALAEYLDSLTRMDEDIRTFSKTRNKKTSSSDRQALIAMETDLRQCRLEFKTATADATFIQGNHIIVPVVINGRGPVMLLFDTGASTVTLSIALAKRLGINWRDGTRVAVSLADGQTVNGYSVLLKSVAVGEFVSMGVRAIVLEKPPGSGIDGLLGMSYLQRFILRIDPAGKKIVMKKIIAR